MIEQPGGNEMDTMVLACTHFPLLAEELAAAFPDIAWVDGAAGIARRIAWLTRGAAMAGLSHRRALPSFTGAPPREALLSCAGPLRPDRGPAPSSCESFSMAFERGRR